MYTNLKQRFLFFGGLFLVLLLMFPPMQNVSSFTPTLSDNRPSVNQEDHDDDDHDCDPAIDDCTTDSDGDGEPDYYDDCPNEPGSMDNYGCPDVNDDPDGDGIVGQWDECPNDYASPPNEVRGCPDSDGDGIADKDDQCPSEQEDWMGPEDGCPTENDSDGDGIPDDQDNCPNTGNQDQADFNNDGNGDVCSDADGDGYYDSFDQCPLEYAYADPNGDGCLDDTDGDGVPDETDQCPNEVGDVNGCPAPTDTDGDGVPDSSDSCPNEFADTSNGCPNISQDTTFQITKITIGGDGSFSFNFDNIGGRQVFTIPDTSTNNVYGPVLFSPDISYTITENVPTDWNLLSSDCKINGISAGGTTFTTSLGDVVECIFTNEYAAPVLVDSDGDGVPDSSDSCITVYGTQTDGCSTPPSIHVSGSSTYMNTSVDIPITTTDPEGENITFTAHDPPHGIISQHHSLTDTSIIYVYVPDTNFIGTDTFTFEASDGYSTSEATISITVSEIGRGTIGTNPVPNDVMTYDDFIQLGSEAWEDGDFSSALSNVQSALDLKPNDVDAQMILAIIYSDGYADYDTALDYAFDAYDDATDSQVRSDIQDFIDYAENLLYGSQDSDGDGISDNEDACPHDPEDNWTYDPVDGCPEEVSDTPIADLSGNLSVEVGSTFFEFVSYMVRGIAIDRSGPAPYQEVHVILMDEDGNEVTSTIANTKTDGSFYTLIGGGSFPGPHTLIVQHGGHEVRKTIQIKPLDGQLQSCQGHSDSTFNDVDLSTPVNDSYCFKLRYGDQVSHKGSVSYGETIQLLGKSMRYNYPDRAIIEVTNPCGNLVYQAPQQIGTDSSVHPKITVTGTGFDLTGTYTADFIHEGNGQKFISTTFTVQAGGAQVFSPTDSQCTGTTGGSGTSGGTGSWKGTVTGYGTLLVKGVYQFVYSIDGTFNFDIKDDGTIVGSGTAAVLPSKTWGLVDQYGYEYSCWSKNNKAEGTSFKTKGEVANGKAYMYLADGSPSEITLLIWCNTPGYHQDFHPAFDPFFFGDDAVFDLKDGASTTVSTTGPFADSQGTIDWNFKITQAGHVDSKFTSNPPKVIPPKAPAPPTPPKVYIPPPTPQITPTPPPKVLPPQAPKPPTNPYVPPTNPYVPPAPPTTPTTPPYVPPAPPTNLVTLSVDTDRLTYNQGNLVTIYTDIDGTTNNENIAISVIDPSGNVVLTRTLFTDDKDSIPFKVSHGTTAGSYKVTASVNVDGKNYEDTSQFTIKKDLAGLSIKSVSATNQQGNPVDSFSQGNQGHIKIVTSSDSFMSDTLVTVTILDYDFIALGTSSIKTSISSGESEIILSYYIPDDTSVGVANIYVNAFTDWPSSGGIPLTRESSAEIGIGVATPPQSTIIDVPTIPETPSPSVQSATVKQVSVPSGTGSPGCELANLCYLPSAAVINQGDSIEWTNKDTAAHTVTSGNPNNGPDNIFDSSLFMAGEKYKVEFNDKGTFEYFCMVHPWMEGKVIVN